MNNVNLKGEFIEFIPDKNQFILHAHDYNSKSELFTPKFISTTSAQLENFSDCKWIVVYFNNHIGKNLEANETFGDAIKRFLDSATEIEKYILYIATSVVAKTVNTELFERLGNFDKSLFKKGASLNDFINKGYSGESLVDQARTYLKTGNHTMLRSQLDVLVSGGGNNSTTTAGRSYK